MNRVNILFNEIVTVGALVDRRKRLITSLEQKCKMHALLQVELNIPEP
jgi:hypothetical protein